MKKKKSNTFLGSQWLLVAYICQMAASMREPGSEKRERERERESNTFYRRTPPRHSSFRHTPHG